MEEPSPGELDYTRLAAARLRAAQAQPFLAMALYALTPLADPSQATFGVDEHWRLYVNPRKVTEWSVLEIAGVLLHEVSHVLRDHAGRARTVAVTDERSGHLWNLAADAEINDDLLRARITLPPAPVTPRALRLPRGKVAEFYYRRLARGSPPKVQGLDCGTGCHGHSGGEAIPLLPRGLSEAEALLLRRRVAEEITRAAAGQPGTVPGGWTRWAQATLHPQLDWRKLLSAKVRSSVAAVAGAADYSYTRPPRRRLPRTILPSLRRPIPRVAVIVDTSGSVPEHLLQVAWTEVHGCLRSLGIRRDLLTVYAADVHAHRLPGPPKRQMALTGGGGTDMANAISVALAARPLPDLVVVITDGETAWPAARPRRDVIIALLGSAPGRPGPPPWAHVISIPDRQADHLTGLATSFRPG